MNFSEMARWYAELEPRVKTGFQLALLVLLCLFIFWRLSHRGPRHHPGSLAPGVAQASDIGGETEPPVRPSTVTPTAKVDPEPSILDAPLPAPLPIPAGDPYRPAVGTAPVDLPGSSFVSSGGPSASQGSVTPKDDSGERVRLLQFTGTFQDQVLYGILEGGPRPYVVKRGDRVLGFRVAYLDRERMVLKKGKLAVELRISEGGRTDAKEEEELIVPGQSKSY